MKGIFVFLLENQVIDGMELAIREHQKGKMATALLDMSSACGRTSDLIQFLLTKDFDRNHKRLDFMQNNSMAMLVIKQHFRNVGSVYAKDLLAPFFERIVDIADIDSDQDNRDFLIDILRSLLQKLFSRDAMESIPPDLRFFSHIVCNLASTYDPSHRHAIVGRFLASCFFLPFIANFEEVISETEFSRPQSFMKKAVSRTVFIENSQVTDKTRSDFHLICNIMLAIFQKSHADGDLELFRNFIDINSERCEQYCREISQEFSAPEVPQKSSLKIDSLHFMKKILIEGSALALGMIQDEAKVNVCKDLVKKLKVHHLMFQLEDLNSKLKGEESVKITISVEVQGQIYDKKISGNFQDLQPFVMNLMVLEPPKKSEEVESLQLGIFGKSIPVVMEKQKLRIPNLEIPEIVQNCLKVLTLKGIFLGNPWEDSEEAVEVASTLQDRIDKGQRIDLTTYSAQEVAQLLKRFLSQIPEPIFPGNTTCVIADLTENSTKFTKMKRRIEFLSPFSRDILKHLIKFLFLLWTSSEKTRIDFAGISDSLGNSIFKLNPSDVEMKRAENLIRFMTTKFHEFFEENSKEEQNPVLKRKIVSGMEMDVVLLCNPPRHLLSSSYKDGIQLWDTSNYAVVAEVAEIKGILCMIQVEELVWCGTTSEIVLLSIHNLEISQKIPMGASSLFQVENQVFANDPNNLSIRVYDVITRHEVFNFQLEIQLEKIWMVGETIWGSYGNSINIYSQDGKIVKELKECQKKGIGALLQVENEIFLRRSPRQHSSLQLGGRFPETI
eukprot:TRINITY_DN3702_c0_g1_i1.p1 TRINITY_DN3702_c0_g1~~TRINITY_DN3702_c0_g1_i1.p1  ORF type:complete len:797 (+),score=302.86 TRINITY_DN3702_c0_g1_i1:47-2392(+)